MDFKRIAGRLWMAVRADSNILLGDDGDRYAAGYPHTPKAITIERADVPTLITALMETVAPRVPQNTLYDDLWGAISGGTPEPSHDKRMTFARQRARGITFEPLADVVLEVIEVGAPCRLSGQTHDGDRVEAEISLPIDSARQLGALLYRDVRVMIVPVSTPPEDERLASLRSWIKARGAVSTDDVLKEFIAAGLHPERLPEL